MTKPTTLRQIWNHYLRPSRPVDISTPEGRRAVMRYMRWFDHGILRSVWHNQHQIAPGVWRSNYPDPRRIARLAEMGIVSIVTLRGLTTTPWFVLEAEACARHGITLHGVTMRSVVAPSRETLKELIGLLRRVERPFLIHCKSGADRTGLAAAIYLIVIEGQSPAKARHMLSLRYLHADFLKAGVLDLLLSDFAASGKTDFEAWVEQDYDAEGLQARFDRGRGR